jgi:TRAP-type C4-dicarboxylate transport system permease small subunit
MSCFIKIIHLLSKVFNQVALVGVLAMMLLASGNVIIRIFYKPILGTFEIVGFLGSVVVFFAIPYTQMQKGLISVAILVSRFSQRTQAIIGIVTYSLSIILCLLIAWQSFLIANDLRQSGELSHTLRIPFYPFVYGVAICCMLWSLVFLLDLFNSIAQAVRK